MLDSILSSVSSPAVTASEFLVCTGVSLAMGVLLAAIHTYRNRVSRNFTLTLVLLPVIVQTVIMMVNGNLGTGVAVMGAFSLVRFRSLPGNSREIASVFLAMALGLAVGMGYIAVAGILLAAVAVVTAVTLTWQGDRDCDRERELKITIPENMDYNGIFDDLFQKYTQEARLMRVRTVNMGSLYELQYHVCLENESQEKEFLDQIRCRNGNLSLVCGRISLGREEL